MNKNLWLVLEGDDGGQVYLTCPVRLVPGLEVRPWDVRQDYRPCVADSRGVIPPEEMRRQAERGDWHVIVRLPEGVRQLLRELDRAAWPGNDGEGTSVDVHARIGNDPWTHEHEVIGGMGGGDLADGLWLHEEFSDPKWRSRAAELLGIR